MEGDLIYETTYVHTSYTSYEYTQYIEFCRSVILRFITGHTEAHVNSKYEGWVPG